VSTEFGVDGILCRRNSVSTEFRVDGIPCRRNSVSTGEFRVDGIPWTPRGVHLVEKNFEKCFYYKYLFFLLFKIADQRTSVIFNY
jgi:hypothetical protein